MSCSDLCGQTRILEKSYFSFFFFLFDDKCKENMLFAGGRTGNLWQS